MRHHHVHHHHHHHGGKLMTNLFELNLLDLKELKNVKQDENRKRTQKLKRT